MTTLSTVWTRTTLGDECDFIRGVTFAEGDATPAPAAGKTPILRAGNIGDELNVNSDLVWVPRVLVDERQLLRKNDVVVCMSSGSSEVVGKTARVSANRNASVGSFCGIIRARNPAKATYLSYYFRSPAFRAQRDRIARGANIQNLRFSQFENMEIPIPTDQQRIAALLDKTDRLRRMRRYALELSDQFLPALFLRMFGDPVGNERCHDVGELGDELESIDSGSSPVCGDQRASPSQWAILGLGAVTTGRFLPADNKRLLPGVEPRPELEVKDRDVLITRKNTTDLVAACVLVRKPPPRLLLPDTVFRFTLRQDSRLTPEYLWALFSFPSFRRKVQRLATGSAGSMPNISKEKFGEVCCPLPPRTAIERFSQMVNDWNGTCGIHREALRQAEHLFQSLLNQYFGEEN